MAVKLKVTQLTRFTWAFIRRNLTCLSSQIRPRITDSQITTLHTFNFLTPKAKTYTLLLPSHGPHFQFSSTSSNPLPIAFSTTTTLCHHKEHTNASIPHQPKMHHFQQPQLKLHQYTHLLILYLTHFHTLISTHTQPLTTSLHLHRTPTTRTSSKVSNKPL